jgi:creatinine amidohydrolase
MPRPWVLAEQSHAFVRERKWEVAVLPFGATEPHNLHMPYGTDNFQVDEIGSRACERAFGAGANVLLLPTIPFGVNTNHLKVPGGLALSVNPTTLFALLTDLVDSLERQGVRKLVLLNGHGGNELKPLMRELHHRTKVFICLCDWFRMGTDTYAGTFKKPGEHADEVETSLGLAFFPHLMHPELADDGAARPTRFEALNRGWVSMTRPWHLVSKNTGLGDPSAATAEKGEKLMGVLVERLSAFLVELSSAKMDENFPYYRKHGSRKREARANTSLALRFRLPNSLSRLERTFPSRNCIGPFARCFRIEACARLIRRWRGSLRSRILLLRLLLR